MALERAAVIERMARFRNILVHLYARVDLRRVVEILKQHLGDFGRFAQCTQDFLRRDPGHVADPTGRNP